MKTDVQLILKIAGLLQMVPDCYEISTILEEYRSENDPNLIYHKLCDYEEKVLLSKIELSDDGADGTETEQANRDNYWYWISVGDEFSIQVNNLKSIKKLDLWEDNHQVYAIRLNEVNTNFTSTNFPHPNTDIKFFSESQRDKEWNRVKKRLAVFTFIRFL